MGEAKKARPLPPMTAEERQANLRIARVVRAAVTAYREPPGKDYVPDPIDLKLTEAVQWRLHHPAAAPAPHNQEGLLVSAIILTLAVDERTL